MKKYPYIDLMKTAAMFMVIVAHSILFWGNNIFWPLRADRESAAVIFIYNFFDVACLPIFVFAAGFLFQFTLQNKTYSIPEMIVKRLKRLVLPCFIYGAFWVVPLYTLLDIPVFGREKGTSLTDGYKAMLLGRFADVNWFMFMLFWVSLIWILCRTLLKKERLLLGAAASLVFFFIAHYGLANVDFYKISQIDIHIIEYFAGAAFYYAADTINEKLCKEVQIGASALLLILCIPAAQLISEYYVAACVLRIVIPPLFAVLAMGMCRIDAVRKLEDTSAYRWLVKNNLYIYLFQAPNVYIGYRLISPLLGGCIPLCVAGIVLFVVVTDFIMVEVFIRIRRLIKMGG